MIKRLFLNGIIVDSRQFPVYLSDQNGIHISSYPAFPCFTLRKGAEMGTKKALYLVVANLLKKPGLSHDFVQVKESRGICVRVKDQK